MAALLELFFYKQAFRSILQTSSVLTNQVLPSIIVGPITV